MIYSDVDMLRAVELRCMSTPISGSLCYSDYDILPAARHFDIEPYFGQFGNPFMELPEDMIKQFTPEIWRIFIEYVRQFKPPFTLSEKQYIIDANKLTLYEVICNGPYINIVRR